MIHHALIFITSSLNDHLKKSLNTTEDKVVLSNLVELDGTIIPLTENKLVITVFNLLPESSSNHIGINKSAEVKSNGNLSTCFIVSANFKNYTESLQIISLVPDFFRNNNIFSSSIDLPAGLSEIKLEDIKLDFADLSSIWGYLGANYRPSLNYKITIARSK